MAIDDELDQLKQQYPEATENAGLEVTLNLLSALPTVGPAVAVVQGLREHFSTRREIHRLQVLFEALEGEVRRQGKTLAEVQAEIQTPEALDSIIRTVNITVQISNEWKIENFGTVLGYEAASHDRKGWDEASALVEDLAQLTDEDLGTLSLLVRHQSEFAKSNLTTHDYNNLVASMRAVFAEVDKSSVGRGEFYSHAFRLVGFGLAIPLNFNPSAMGPQDQGIAVTVRGVRLMRILDA
jgi:hypothetical protein